MSLIDYRDPRPVYEQIVDYFEKLILQGVLKPDDKMPSVRQTASEWTINPNTIQKAFSVLENRGYIYAVPGRGNFVADSAKLLEEKKSEQLEKQEKVLREGKEIGITEEQAEEVVRRVYGSDKS